MGEAKQSPVKVMEFGNRKILLNPEDVSIDQWGRLMLAVFAGDKEAGNKCLVEITMTMVGDQGKGLSIMYLSAVLSAVSQVIQDYLSGGTVEDEVSEIISRQLGKSA